MDFEYQDQQEDQQMTVLNKIVSHRVLEMGDDHQSSSVDENIQERGTVSFQLDKMDKLKKIQLLTHIGKIKCLLREWSSCINGYF